MNGLDYLYGLSAWFENYLKNKSYIFININLGLFKDKLSSFKKSFKQLKSPNRQVALKMISELEDTMRMDYNLPQKDEHLITSEEIIDKIEQVFMSKQICENSFSRKNDCFFKTYLKTEDIRLQPPIPFRPSLKFYRGYSRLFNRESDCDTTKEEIDEQIKQLKIKLKEDKNKNMTAKSNIILNRKINNALKLDYESIKTELCRFDHQLYEIKKLLQAESMDKSKVNNRVKAIEVNISIMEHYVKFNKKEKLLQMLMNYLDSVSEEPYSRFPVSIRYQ